MQWNTACSPRSILERNKDFLSSRYIILVLTLKKRSRITESPGEGLPLPPGMGNIPLHHVEGYPDNLPEKWASYGRVFMPMYRSEALWSSFESGHANYPIALQIAAIFALIVRNAEGTTLTKATVKISAQLQ